VSSTPKLSTRCRLQSKPERLKHNGQFSILWPAEEAVDAPVAILPNKINFVVEHFGVRILNNA
jgi:hypothetical protein